MMLNYGPPKMTYNDNTSHALAYLLPMQERLVPMTECIYRVEAHIPVASHKGVLLQSKITGQWMLSARTEEERGRLLCEIPPDASSLLVTTVDERDAALTRFPRMRAEAVTPWRFPSLEPPVFPLPFEVWPLDEGDLAQTLEWLPNAEPKSLSLQIQRKQVYGACIDDTLAGTVGTAPDGGIAWLSADPNRSEQGIENTLLLWIIRRELRNGHIPFLLLSNDETALAPRLEQAGMVSGQPLWRLTL